MSVSELYSTDIFVYFVLKPHSFLKIAFNKNGISLGEYLLIFFQSFFFLINLSQLLIYHRNLFEVLNE